MAGDEPKSLSVNLDDDLIESRVRVLVERGLERYGAGDLDGAMSEWEHALALDPENAQAREYVDYVQKNFQVLDATFRAAKDVSDPSAEHDVPFGLEDFDGEEMDDEAYESLEIGEKENGSAAASPASATSSGSGSVDEGWAIDEGWSLDAVPSVSPKAAPKEEAPEEEAEDLGSALGEVAAGLDSLDRELTLEEPPSEEPDALELEPELPQEVVLEAEEPDDAAEEDHDFGTQTSQGVGDVEPFSSDLSDDAILALGTPSPDETRAADEATERSAEVSGLDPADFEDMETVERRDDRFGELELGQAGKSGPSRAEMEQHLESLEADLGHRETVELSSRAITDEPTNELERDEPTAEIKALQRAPIAAGPHAAREAPATIDFDEVARDVLARSDARVDRLLDLARQEQQKGTLPIAVVALDLALEEASKSAEAQGLVDEHHDDVLELYETYLGEPNAVPALAVPLHELEMHKLDHRAAFLLSRVDGALSVEDILDVCGMSRLEAYRHLCRLIVQGILKVR